MDQEIDLGIKGLHSCRLIGQGGFARVYAAYDEGFSRWVAVKVLLHLDDDGRRRFDRERGLMGRLDDHPNVVTPYRFGETNDGLPYLVMEYLRGGSLRQLLDSRGPLPWSEAVGYILPVADALARAHREGILHRDVKPANILLTADGEPKLSDFGISTLRQSTATQRAFTLAHAAPESFADGSDRRDHRSDLYSLASTLFTIVKGRPPFHIDGQDSDPSYVFRVLDFGIPPVDENPDHNAFMARALAKNPADRPQDAAAFIDALQATVDQSIAGTLVEEQPQQRTGRRPRRRRAMTAEADGPQLLGVEAPGRTGPQAGLQAGTQTSAMGEQVKSAGIAGRLGVFGLLAVIGIVALVAVTVGSFGSSSGDESAGPDTHTSLRLAQPERGAEAGDVPTAEANGEPVEPDDSAAVLSVHARYMTQLFNRDEREIPPDQWLPLAEELTTGRALATIRDRTAGRMSTGNRLVSPGYRSNVVSLLIDGDSAIVIDCSQDTGELYSADGLVLVGADDFYKLRTASLVRIDGRWFVENLDTDGDEFCEPAA